MPVPKKRKKELPPSDDPQRPPQGRGSGTHGPNVAPSGAGQRPGRYEEESDGRA